MPKEIAGVTLYTVTEISEKLGVSEITIRNYINEGRLQATKIARKWHVSEEVLQSFVKGKLQG